MMELVWNTNSSKTKEGIGAGVCGLRLGLKRLILCDSMTVYQVVVMAINYCVQKNMKRAFKKNLNSYLQWWSAND